MAVVIQLTQEQWEALTIERAKLGEMEVAKAPGMMIAQVFGDHMKVAVIDNDKARAIQRAFGVANDGKTCRTAYDVPANDKAHGRCADSCAESPAAAGSAAD
ncbi:MAG: hypothetical protein KKF85_03555 [Gammaproteobacteria bacterium]|nr:hypothetical protein [Gammaproteobacteria bacterium]MBU4146024.1 hypothetical protein [Gammaproteobacteria bacterium]